MEERQDLISRRAAIDALDEQIEQCNRALGAFNISLKDEYAIKVERASLKAYKEQLENMPSVQPEQVCVANVTLTDEQVKEVVEKAKNAVISVIELEPHWIPCSERLPEIGEYVLCYLKGRRYFGQYRVCKYCAADKYVNHPYFDFNENGFPNVVAWMPLPEPYRGGEK